MNTKTNYQKKINLVYLSMIELLSKPSGKGSEHPPTHPPWARGPWGRGVKNPFQQMERTKPHFYLKKVAGEAGFRTG